MKAYMKQYAKESGWTLGHLRLHKTYVDFELQAVSRRS